MGEGHLWYVMFGEEFKGIYEYAAACRVADELIQAHPDIRIGVVRADAWPARPLWNWEDTE